MIKLLSLSGNRIAKRKSLYGGFRMYISFRFNGRSDVEKTEKPPKVMENIVDFETLLAWQGELKKTAAAGNEMSLAHIYSMKQKELKFL